MMSGWYLHIKKMNELDLIVLRGCLADVEVGALAQAEMVVQKTPTCFSGKQSDT